MTFFFYMKQLGFLTFIDNSFEFEQRILALQFSSCIKMFQNYAEGAGASKLEIRVHMN